MNQPKLTRILYVDDDPDLRMMTLLVLVDLAGFEVLGCSSGEEAIQQARSFVPQLFLLDVVMPDMDGPATLAQLRALPGLADTPAIFMTAKVRPSDVAHYRELGAIHVIDKPFDPMQLADDIMQAWDSQPGHH